MQRYLVLASLAVFVRQATAFTHSSSLAHQKQVRKSPSNRRLIEPRQSNRLEESTTQLRLSTSSLISSVASPLGAVSVLAGVVLIHEAGHYLAARSFGITVEEFSVGVGPKLTGLTAANGEEFSLRAFPLGGYVRFPENYNVTLVRQQEKEIFEAKRSARKERKEQNKKEPRVGFSLFGKNKKRLEVERLEKELMEQERKSLWARAFSSVSNIRNNKKSAKNPPKSVEIDYYDDPNLLQNRPWAQRAAVLSGGILFNFILAFLCFFGEITVGNGLPHPVVETGAVVVSMRSDSPSQSALQPGDVIVGINGASLTKASSLGSSQSAISDLIGDIRATPVGDSIALQVKRPKLNDVIDVVVKPRPLATQSTQSLGVMLAPNYIRTDVIRTSSIREASILAGQAVGELTSETAGALMRFFSQLIVNNGSAPSGQMSGPIGLIRTGSDVVSRNDISAVVTFAAAISVNLAVINALPLPALDGGQLVFVLAEAVTKRKLDQQVQETITAYTLLFLLLVSVGTAVGDVESIMFTR